MDFEFNQGNLQHLLIDRADRGVTPSLIVEIGDGAPKLFPNEPGEGRTGSHMMVGPDANGRFWTIILLHLHGDLYRPLTGWPSTNPQIRMYREEVE